MSKLASHFFKLFFSLNILIVTYAQAACLSVGATISNTAPIVADKQQVGIDNVGNVIAVWREYDSTVGLGGTTYIRYSTFSPGGVWVEGTITSFLGNDTNSNPVIAVARETGNAVAVWEETDSVGGLSLVKASQRPFSSGVWSTPANISFATTSNLRFPQVAINTISPSTDYAVAIWLENSGSNTYLQSATLNFGGIWSAPIEVVPSTTNNLSQQKVAVDPAGTAYAVWLNSNSTPAPSIEAATLAINGSAL